MKRVKYYFPGKVQDGVLLAKGQLWAGQRGKRFPATSSSARLSVVGSLLIYFICARIYIGVLPASEDVGWQTREPARQPGYMQTIIKLKKKRGGGPSTLHSPQGRILTTFHLFVVARCGQQVRIWINFRLFFVAGGGGLKSALFT